MGEVSPPTQADYASAAASDALAALRLLESRVQRLEDWATKMQAWAKRVDNGQPRSQNREGQP
jgi:hypothetical protein